jgi:hypothetical protein
MSSPRGKSEVLVLIGVVVILLLITLLRRALPKR